MALFLKYVKDTPMGPVPMKWSGSDAEHNAHERSVEAQNRLYWFFRRTTLTVVVIMIAAGAVLIGIGSSVGK